MVRILILWILIPPPVSAFLLGGHKKITGRALERIPSTAPLADWERDDLKEGSRDTDLSEGGLWPPLIAPYEARFHFDRDLDYAAVRRNFQDLMRVARENLAKRNRDPHGFGKILHALEDFYSHSNYVTLYRQYRNDRDLLVVGIPLIEEVLLNPDQYPGFQTVLETSLRTGWYPDHILLEDTDHGSPIIPNYPIIGRGMNKDTSLRLFNRDAEVTATTAAAWYLRLYLKDAEVVEQCQAAWQVRLIP